ncbi:homoserine kinase [Amphritea balenae]|uniref:Homoserine kinase n=1 Tax=Amphritea balenae TaxID=452629 RepID=A0A3P1SRH8_9GAMM|nr:homoserine kinase [Amphritea balenae]RRC98782.1 homoserine kinase [Amphritea balenae]GGK61615.1 homoserine kinase [Amphritea balenae]
MAVYTSVSRDDLQTLLQDFDLGELVDFQGIEGGIENTNYFVSLRDSAGQQQEYVLTLFEELSQDEMPYFVELTTWLSERNCPVPFPFKDRNGIALKSMHNRPALLQPRFAGRHLDKLTPDHCAQIGRALAQFHKAGSDFYLQRQAHRGVFWWRRESQQISRKLNAEDAALLNQEVTLFDQLREQPWELPQGAIHGDLFFDNALFDGDQLSAILDIYNACTGYLLFDLAIVANDWCVNPDGSIDSEREQALLAAYNAVRPFEDNEYLAWPQLTRTAAMRFWLSRLIPALDPDSTQKIKDPDEFRRILQYRVKNAASLAPV